MKDKYKMSDYNSLLLDLLSAMKEKNIATAFAAYEGTHSFGKVHTVCFEDVNKKSLYNAEINNLIIHTVYQVLSNKYPDWEMNEGSSGSISFENKNDKLSVFCEHTEYFVSSQTDVLEFEVTA